MSNKSRLKNEESNPPSPGGLDPAQPAAPQAGALDEYQALVAQVQEALTEANLTQPAQDVALNPNPTEEEYNQGMYLALIGIISALSNDSNPAKL